MSVEIQPSKPAGPSNVLADLEREYTAARAKFATAITAWRQERGYREGSDAVDRRALESFIRTEEGAKLNEACTRADRRWHAARRLTESVTLGGVTFRMRDVRAEAREAVYAAAAEHGFDTDRWPREARAAVSRVLNEAPRALTYGEYAAKRSQELSRAVRSTVAAMLDEHGDDPSRWPDAALDAVALAEHRRVAFELLEHGAREQDAFGWDSKPVAD